MRISRIIGLLTIIASLGFIYNAKNELEIATKGKLVEMTIVDIPGSCLGTKSKYFIKVKFNHQVFVKQIGGNYCEEHKVGDIISLKYLDGKDLVLFPKETVWTKFLSSILIGLMGVYLFFYKKKNNINSFKRKE